MTKVVAEIGANHMGDLDIAFKMIEEAAYCGASIVKFQKRTPKLCVPPEVYNSPHPSPWNSFGDTYGDHREALEFDVAQHAKLKECCEINGVEYSTSVWDTPALLEIQAIKPRLLKIPSAMNNHKVLISAALKYVQTQKQGELHISNGMTTVEELISLEEMARNCHDIHLYHTTSDYPVAPVDLCLHEFVMAGHPYTGFSGHHNGIAIDVAVAGAFLARGEQLRYLERHFTLDRTWKGTDQAASLEPTGLRKLVRDLSNVEKAFMYSRRNGILECEKPHAEKLRFR